MDYTFQDLKNKLLHIRNYYQHYGFTFKHVPEDRDHFEKYRISAADWYADYNETFGIFIIPKDSHAGICLENDSVWFVKTDEVCSMEKMIIYDDNLSIKRFPLSDSLSIPDFKEFLWIADKVRIANHL